MGALAITGASGNSGIVQLGGGAVPEWFEVEVTTTAANQTYSWQISAGTAINAETQWGDGTTQTHTATGIYTKTYANAGVYTLRLKASFGANGAFNMRPGSDRTRLSRLLSPVPPFPGLTSLGSLLFGCTGITNSIPADFLRYAGPVVTFSNLFRDCSNIAGAIPADLLRYAANGTTFTGFMLGCPNITGSVPVDFLRYVNASALGSLLDGCVRLRLQPDIFGPNPAGRFLNLSPNFSNSFRNIGTFAGTPQGTAPPIWTYNFGTGAPVTTSAFANNSTSLSNWAQIPIAWGGPA